MQGWLLDRAVLEAGIGSGEMLPVSTHRQA